MICVSDKSSMASSEWHLEDIDKCSICLDSFKDPRSLPCIHTFCCECISGYITINIFNGLIRCPMCRKTFTVPPEGGTGLPKNLFIQQLLEMKNLCSAVAACEVCENDAIAVKFCATCRQKLCRRCSKSHKKIRTTKSHRLFSITGSNEKSEEAAKLMRSYCKDHDERTLEMYCSECEEVMCLLCYVLKHHGHDCKHVDKAAEEHRLRLEQDIDDVAETIGSDKSLLRNINEKKKHLESSLEQTKSDILKQAKVLKSAIDRQAKNLIAEAEELAEKKGKEIEKQTTKIEKSVSLKQGFYNYMKQVYDSGTSVDLVRDAEKLHQRATEIESEDAQTQSQLKIIFSVRREMASKFLSKDGIVGTVVLGNNARKFHHHHLFVRKNAVGERDMQGSVSALKAPPKLHKKKKKNLYSKLAYKISNKKSRNGRLPERPYGHPGLPIYFLNSFSSSTPYLF